MVSGDIGYYIKLLDLGKEVSDTIYIVCGGRDTPRKKPEDPKRDLWR